MPSAEGRAEAMEMFREVNDEPAKTGAKPGVATDVKGVPSAEGRAEAMEMFREVNDDTPAKTGAKPGAATNVKGVPSAEGRAEAMEMFREVNGEAPAKTGAQPGAATNVKGVPSAEGRVEAMEMFREVNGDAATTGKPDPRIAAIAADLEVGPPAQTVAPKTVGVPSAEGRAEAMEMFREVNGAAATTGKPDPRIAAIAADLEVGPPAQTVAPKTVGVPSAEGRAEAMEMFREVNAEPKKGVPSAEGRAEAMEMFREVNGDPSTTGKPDPRIAAIAADLEVGPPTQTGGVAPKTVGVPSAEGRAEAMEMFREVNAEPKKGAPSTEGRAEAMEMFREVNGDAPANTGAQPGTATNVKGVPSAEGRAEAMEMFREVNGEPAHTHTEIKADAHVAQPAIESHDITQHAPSAEGDKAAAAQHEVAQAKLHNAPTQDIERPEIGKPQEVADTTQAIDPRGTAKPDVGDQVSQINQLAAPHSEKPNDDELDQLAHEAEHKSVLDDVKEPDAVEPTLHAEESKIDAAHDAKVGQAVQHHEAMHARHRDKASHQKTQIAQHGQHAIATHHKTLADAKAHKHVSKDELRAKLTQAADGKRQKLDQDFENKKVELDTKLKAKIDCAKEALDKANAKITAELDAKAKQLEADIAKRKAKHDAEIAKKRPALEKQGQQEQDALRAKAKTDADGIRAEAAKQAEATQLNAETRATDTEGKGETEAKAAIAAGETQAKRATDAAESRAKSLTDSGEADHVRGEGKTRAEMARSAAVKRTDEIRAQAKVAAKALRDKGKADHDAEIKHGEDRAAEAIKNGEAAAGKVKAKTDDAIKAMQAESDAAVAKMNSEVAQMRAEVEAKRATMNANGAKAIADAQAKIEAEKTKALADMQAAHDKAKKTIDDTVAKDLDKIDHANEKDLQRLEHEVDQDIQKIDQATRQAHAAMDRSIAQAEQKAAVQVSRAKATINADRAKALCQIHQSAQQARQRIAADDKDTKKKIDAAADQGKRDIAAMSTQATTELEAANGKLVEQTKAEGDAHRAEADKQAADAGKAMEDSRKKLDGEITKAWVDDAVGKSHKLMERSWKDWAVTDHEAVEAMNDLNSLPPDAQGDAIKQLDKDDFGKLLHEVPEDRREEFKSLVDNTHDPERKLQLWGEYHKSHVENDAKKDAKSTEDTGWWPFESKEQDINRHKNKIRNAAVSDTKDEVDDEIKFLEEKQKAGTLTEADVVALENRKEKEHQIERKYDVNLTNKEGKRADGTKIAWTDHELDEVDSALGRVPRSAVNDNEMLKRIERSDMSEDEDDKKNPVIGGDHSGGVIKIYDVGTTPGFRIDGQNRELADPKVAPTVGPTLGSIEVSLDHELGHDMHDQNSDAFKRYQAAAGWQDDVGDKQMKNQGGLTDDQIKQLHDASEKHQHMELVGKDGKVYENDPYSKGDIVAYDKDALPTTADAQPGTLGINSDTWWYARSNKKDDFAEQYTKAVHTPETLAKDMLDAPQARVTKATADRDVNQTALTAEKAKTPPDPAVVATLETNLKKSQDEVAAAQKEQTARKTQFDIMRDDIFHTDQETAAAVKRLEARKVDPAKIAEFKDKAARASTPQQINVLESNY